MDDELFDYTNQLITKEEAQGIYDIQKEMLNSWAKSKDSMTVEEWIKTVFKEQLPDKNESEIQAMSDEIVNTLKITETKKNELEKAIASGRDKNSWLASELEKSTSHMSAQDSARYLQNLDDAVNSANEAMRDTITRKDGFVNMNPNLDGFIAETQHVNSFNMKAKAIGSDLHAEVLKPKPGETYSANSVDIVIKDSSGKIVRRYQAKYGATAEDTIRMIKEGNYRGQQLIVPEDQVEAVQKAFPDRKVSSTVLEGNVSSKPLTKEEAKKLQEEAQKKGSFLETDWSGYSNKDIALGVAGEVGKATLMGVAVGVGMNILGDIIKGETIEGEDVVKTAVTTGADFGVKAAVASGLKVATEKKILSIIPKGTPASTLTSIAFVGVENVKILGNVATGEITPQEGLYKMEQTTVSCVAGIVASAKGGSIGATIGTVLGPIGTAIGAFIGSTVGYIAGSKVGDVVVKGAQKVRDCAVGVVKTAVKAVGGAVRSVGRAIASLFS